MATEDIIARYKLDLNDLQTKVRLLESEFGKVKDSAEKSAKATQKAFADSEKGANVFSNTLNNLGRQIVAAFAIERIIAFGAASVKAFADAEKTAKLLQTAVGVSGGLGKDFDRLIKQSEQLQKIGIFSDGDIQKVQKMALQFGLTADQTEKLIPIVLDFASATGQDLAGALDAVLMGVEGQERGLKKYGVTLQDGATRTENLQRISEQLSRTYQGQAEIVGNTAAGAILKYNNNLNNLQEKIGEQLAPKLQHLRDLFLQLADDALNALFPDIQKKSDLEKQIENLVGIFESDKSASEQSLKNEISHSNILIAQLEGRKLIVQEERKSAIFGNAKTKELEELNKKIEDQKRIQQAINIVLQRRSEIPTEKTGGLETRDAEDRAKKEAEAAKKAAEQVEKDKERFAQNAKDRTEAEFQFQLDFISQLAALEIQSGVTIEQAERNKLVRMIELRKEYNKDVGDLILQLAKQDASRPIAGPTREGFDEQNKIIEDAQAKADAKRLADAKTLAEQIKDIQIEIAEEISSGILDIAFDTASQQNEIAQEKLQEESDVQTKAIDDQIAGIERKNERGLISDAKAAAEKKKLEDLKLRQEQQAQAKINALKHQQDVADQQRKLFEIAIATARNAIEQPGLFGALIPYWIGLGAAQAAIVLASSLPKYFKGTPFLERGNNPSGRDTIPFMGHEGEAIIPSDKNKQRPGLAKAWIGGDLDRYLFANHIVPALEKQKKTFEKSVMINSKVSINEKELAKEIGDVLYYMNRGEEKKFVMIHPKALRQLASIIELQNDLNRR